MIFNHSKYELKNIKRVSKILAQILHEHVTYMVWESVCDSMCDGLCDDIGDGVCDSVSDDVCVMLGGKLCVMFCVIFCVMLWVIVWVMFWVVCRRTDWLTNKRTFALLESLLQLKTLENCLIISCKANNSERQVGFERRKDILEMLLQLKATSNTDDDIQLWIYLFESVFCW